MDAAGRLRCRKRDVVAVAAPRVDRHAAVVLLSECSNKSDVVVSWVFLGEESRVFLPTKRA